MRKKIIVLSIAVLTASLFGMKALADYGDSNSLHGKVKENGTKNSIYGAKVKLYTKSGGKLIDSDKTSKTGTYKFDDLTEKKYKVQARATGYRNPKNIKKDTVSKIVDVDGDVKKNLYLEKI